MSFNSGNKVHAIRNEPREPAGRPKAPIFLVVIALVAVLAYSSMYTTNEMQQAIITQLGKPIGEPISQPGLHFKVPFIQHVNYIERRILSWDGRPNQIPTRDKKYILVDTTARWKIVDPLKYFVSVQTETSAQGRLDDIIDSATRDVVSNENLVEMVRDSNRVLDEVNTSTPSDSEPSGEIERIFTGRSALQTAIATRAAELVPQYGIELVDVKIKRINYESSVERKVFERMISERLKIAEAIRSEGQGRRAEINGAMERELKKIRSEAYQHAEGVKGTADAEATAIYADAYGKDERFYDFLKSLETYRTTLDKESVLILSTDNEYLRHLSTSK